MFLTDRTINCQSQMMRNVLIRIFVFMSYFMRFLVFDICPILYFTIVIHSGLNRNFKKLVEEGGGGDGLVPQWSSALGTRMLLVSVNGIFRKNLFKIFRKTPLLNTKSNISQKLRISQEKNSRIRDPIQNIYFRTLRNNLDQKWKQFF